MWHLFCYSWFLISSSFGTLGGLHFAIMVFPEYLHLYFGISWKMIH